MKICYGQLCVPLTLNGCPHFYCEAILQPERAGETQLNKKDEKECYRLWLVIIFSHIKVACRCLKCAASVRTMATVFVATPLFPGLARANDMDRSLVRAFCFVLQAQAPCENLLIHAQTENKLERKLGGPIRGPGSPYNADCLAGIEDDIESENDVGFCESVWKHYGCSGDRIPRLIMESPFTMKNPRLCAF